MGALFKRLLVALKRGGDHDNVIWLLRKEGVHEGDISYAIRHLKMPMAYAEAIERDPEENGEWEDAEDLELDEDEELDDFDEDDDRIEW